MAGFGERSACLTAKLLQRGCRCRKLREAFPEFCRGHCGLVSGFGVGLGTLLREGISGPEFYGDLVYRFGKLAGRNDVLFGSEGSWHVTDVWVMACMLCGGLRAWFLAQSWLIAVLPSLVARRWVGRRALWWPRRGAIHFGWLGPELLVCCLAHRDSAGVFLLHRVSVGCLAPGDLHHREAC